MKEGLIILQRTPVIVSIHGNPFCPKSHFPSSESTAVGIEFQTILWSLAHQAIVGYFLHFLEVIIKENTKVNNMFPLALSHKVEL